MVVDPVDPVEPVPTDVPEEVLDPFVVADVLPELVPEEEVPPEVDEVEFPPPLVAEGVSSKQEGSSAREKSAIQETCGRFIWAA